MTATTASLLPPSAKEIPTSFTASVRSWWAVSEKQSAWSEERLLRSLPFFQPSGASESLDPTSRVVGKSSKVELSNPKHFLNTFSITPTHPSPAAPPAAVILHGYGAGLGFFFRNFPSLARWVEQRGSAVYAVDWLGHGRSARPTFTIKSKRDDTKARVHEAESFFVESLEDWRQKQGLEKMTLIAHSLGAYMSVAYALRYPTRVTKLVLLSPAGVPRNPDDESIPSQEVNTDQQEIASPHPDKARPANPMHVQEVKDRQRRARRQESRLAKVVTYLWEEGWSPFAVIRTLGFWGPMMVGRYSTRRFSGLTEEETRNMHDYILNITMAKGSGEYCISHILAPFAHARMPLVDRMDALKIPIVFMYGDHDWMDPAGGLAAIENLRNAGNTSCRQYIIPNAGHHLYLDNVSATDELLIKELNRT